MDIQSIDDAKAEVAAALTVMLGDTIRLYAKLNGFYWQKRDFCFSFPYRLFEWQYQELWAAVDPIAERLRSLDPAAPSSLTALAALGELPETEGKPSGQEMVLAALDGHLTLARQAGAVMQIAERCGDLATAELMTDRLASHERTAWIIRAQFAEEVPMPNARFGSS